MRDFRDAKAMARTLRATLATSERDHEYTTLEHLLLALIDDADASEVMEVCKVDLGALTEISSVTYTVHIWDQRMLLVATARPEFTAPWPDHRCSSTRILSPAGRSLRRC